MAVVDNILSGVSRQTLFAIKRTASELAVSQQRLATGKKVNTALDNPQNFFAASSLQAEAHALDRILDNIGQATQTLKTAQAGAASLQTLLEQAEAIAKDAQAGPPDELSAQILADDPQAYWRLNETGGTTADNLGNLGDVIDMTYENSPTFSQPPLYEAGGETSTEFNGINQYAWGPIATDLTNVQTPERTIELTFTADTTAGRQVLYEEGGNSHGLNIYIDDGDLYFHGFEAFQWRAFVSTEINAGETYHISLTLDAAAGELTGFVNGERIGTDATAGLLEPRFGVSIGARYFNAQFHDGGVAGNGNYFDGQISDVAVYDKVISDNGIRQRATLVNKPDITTRQEQFETTLSMIDQLVSDSNYRGNNLLDAGALTVQLNEDKSSTLEVTGAGFSQESLGLIDRLIKGDTYIDESLSAIRNALEDVRSFENSLANDLRLLQIRADHALSKANVLREGADKLTLADGNEESAKLLSAQVQQQLQFTALSSVSSLSIGNFLFDLIL